MPNITLSTNLDTRPIDALVARLHQRLLQGLVLRLDRGPDMAVQGIQVFGHPSFVDLTFLFAADAEAGVHTVDPLESFSQSTRLTLQYGARGDTTRRYSYTWTQGSLDGITLPPFPSPTHADVRPERAAWTITPRHGRSGITHVGFGMVSAPLSNTYAHAQLRRLLNDAPMKVFPGEDVPMPGHARLHARSERAEVLSIFEVLDQPRPGPDDAIVASSAADRVVVGSYTPKDRVAWPVFSVA